MEIIMSVIYLCAALYLLFFVLIYYSSLKPAAGIDKKKKTNYAPLVIALIFSLAVRIIIASSVEGHSTDINCFKSWASMAYEGGLKSFYTAEAFTDYPPGYIYVLWFIGFIRSIFNIDYYSTLYTVIIKLPAILCDILSGIFVYKFIEKRTNSSLALTLSFLYLINPAVILNSAAWGQVDSVFTLFVLAYIYFISEKKLLPACISFTLGALIKPQTVIFTPILLLYLYKILFMDKTDIKASLKDIAISALSSIALLFVLLLPFASRFNFMPVIEQYISTLSSYKYASVNAYNVFALFGGIWRDVSEPFLFIPYSVWTYIVVFAILFVCGYKYIKDKENSMFLIAAFIISALFTCAAKMHERYIFPAMLFLLFAFAQKKDIRIIPLFALLSIGQFLNSGAVLCENIINNSSAPPEGALVPVVSLINIAAFVYLLYIMFSKPSNMQDAATKTPHKNAAVKKPSPAPFCLQKSAPSLSLTKADALIMAIVTLIYAVIAFINLGDMKAPVTMWNSMYTGDGFVVEFEDNTYIKSMSYFTGNYENRTVDISVESENGSTNDSINLSAVFCWHSYSMEEKVKRITLTTTDYDTAIAEIVFIDEAENIIKPKNVTPIGNDCGIEFLFDEQNLLPKEFSYKNSTYFDEIYHARTAYEYLHSLSVYETTHPPLGKLIISIGIILFGANPFGWRFMGTLFGIMMLPALYIFAKKMFRATPAAAAVIVIFAADFMHFAQTRIATIDVYVTFFIILAYYFMYDYTTKSFYDTPFKKTLAPLALSGLFMGLSIASKWTGIYAALGLAVLFFISFGKRIYEYKKINSDTHVSKEDKKLTENCKKYCIYTILWCMVFFVAVPAFIYALSYIPYLRAPGMEGIKSIIENQTSMLSYHSNLTDTHPFSSLWYQWPLDVRPIWYYSGHNLAGKAESIASFGNPFVWWMGILAFVYCIYKIFKKSYSALFLVVAFLAQYLPWVGVTRVVFIYHYFPSVPFIILMTGYGIKNLFARYPICTPFYKSKALWAVAVYCLVCIVAFAAFYPVLSGMAVSDSYIASLRWYESWTF